MADTPPLGNLATRRLLIPGDRVAPVRIVLYVDLTPGTGLDLQVRLGDPRQFVEAFDVVDLAGTILGTLPSVKREHNPPNT